MQKGLISSLWMASSIAFAGTMSDVRPIGFPDGFYAGLGIGAQSLDFRTTVQSLALHVEHFGQSNVLGDVFVGYNRNLNSWFNLGLEVFYTFYDINTTLSGGNLSAASVYKTNNNYGLKLMPAVNLGQNARWFIDVGAVGGNFQYNTSVLAREFGSPSRYSKTLAGLMLGVGTDVAITSHLSIRGEYQNISYNRWNISTPLVGGLVANTRFQNTENEFITSLIYHFG